MTCVLPVSDTSLVWHPLLCDCSESTLYYFVQYIRFPNPYLRRVLASVMKRYALVDLLFRKNPVKF